MTGGQAFVIVVLAAVGGCIQSSKFITTIAAYILYALAISLARYWGNA